MLRTLELSHQTGEDFTVRSQQPGGTLKGIFELSLVNWTRPIGLAFTVVIASLALLC